MWVHCFERTRTQHLTLALVSRRYLIGCIQLELRNAMPSFLIDSDDDLHDDGELCVTRGVRTVSRRPASCASCP